MRRSAGDRVPRIVRLIWLIALILWDDPACFAGYRRRFGLSMHAFRRDFRAVRRVSRYLEECIYIQFGMLIYLCLTELR